MAKPKKYITSKLKPKRKFLLGGNPEQELYLNDNVTYQAKDGPTQQMQQEFNTRQQARAEQMANLQQSMVNQQMMANKAANAAEEERKKKEAEGRKAENEAAKDKAIGTVTTGASNIGKDLLQNAITPTGTNLATKAAPSAAKPVMMHQGTASTGAFNAGTKTSTVATGAKVAESAGQMSNLAAAGTSLGLIAAGEGAGYWATRRQNKIDEGRGYSDYYRDTHYTGREAAGQIAKSTLKGAGYGVSLGHAVPGIGEAVGAAVGTQAGLMVGTGIAAKQYYDTKGVKVFGKQYGAKNKYDENLDPNVIAERNQQAQIKAMGETAAAMDTARLGSMTQYDTNTGFNLKTTTGQMAKYGGKLEYLKGGVAKPLGRGAKEYVGKKHEEGGIDLPGNIEVEGGETEQNNYIFSATLKLPTGITYAKAHKNLLASGASSEEIKQLALSQEAAAGRNPNEIKTMKFAKYGGPLQYEDGGNTETDPPKESKSEKLTGDEGYWQIYNIAKKLGEPFPEVVAAQWAIESGWGASDTGTNNPFGQTAAKGESSTNLGTPDDPSRGSKNFVNYGSLEEAVQARINKWSSKYKDAKTPEEALYILQNNGGEPRYAEGFPNEKFPKGDWEQYIKTAMGIINKRPVSVEDPNFVKNENQSSSVNDIPTLQKMLVDSGMSDEEFGAGIYPKELVAKVRNGTATTKELEDAAAAYEAKQLAEENPTSTNEVLNAVFKPKLHKGKENPYIPIGVTAAKNPKKVVTEAPVVAPPTTTTTQTPVVTQTPIGVAPPVTSTVTETPKTATTTTGKFRDINMNPIPLEEEEVPTFITDAKTGERIELNPKRDNFNPDIVPDSKYSSGTNIGSVTEEKKEEKKKENKKTTSTNTPNDYKGLAYAAQFAQPAYALFNPYKSVYNEAPVSVPTGLAGSVPTVNANINLGRVSAAETIANNNAVTNAIMSNAQNVAGPAGYAMQLAALEKNKAGTASAIDAANKLNMQLGAQEANARLTASAANQKAAQNAIQLQSQLGAQQAQMDAGRNARMATAKETANNERYLNTAGAIGAAGVGIGTMYKDQNQLDTQYKIALATDPTGSAVRWLQANDPNAYARYVKEQTESTPETKKFGGPKNSYVSRLGQLTKRPLKAKI